MTLDALRLLLFDAPLVASVQASEGAAVDDPRTLARMARDHVTQGVRVLRLQGIENIRAIRQALPGVPTIGLIKRAYAGFEPYITASEAEVDALLELGCEVIALDGTRRVRPSGDLAALIARVHEAGRIAMADCDLADSVAYSRDCRADLVGTTLAGYTAESRATEGPDLNLLREAVGLAPVVIAEGRYSQRWQVEAALQAGAAGVVVGGALNDPVKTTRAMMPRAPGVEPVAAFDLGGTWLRFATLVEGELEIERIPMPGTRRERLAWMRERVAQSGAGRAAVSTGGTVDPATGEVWEAKPMIPEHLHTVFSHEALGVPTIALNDGLATALAHARLPEFAGKRVATLALGTGVGAGFVAGGTLVMGRQGEYPRLNDVPLPGGGTIEEALGGAALTSEPSASAQARAVEAYRLAAQIVRETLFPDVLVIGGAVGLSDWLRPHLGEGAVASPFGPDAGLHGAMSLARWGL